MSDQGHIENDSVTQWWKIYWTKYMALHTSSTCGVRVWYTHHLLLLF